VYSDNKALQWLFQVKTPTSRLMRWKLQLAQYDFEIIHIKGKANVVADCSIMPTIMPLYHVNIVTRAQSNLQQNLNNPELPFTKTSPTTDI